MAREGILRGKKDNSRRKFTGGGPRPDLNELKREEAEERNAAFARMTGKEQLASLDRRLGPGMGAQKQRAKIQAMIDSPPPVKQAAPVEVAKKSAGKKAKDRRADEQTKRASKLAS